MALKVDNGLLMTDTGKTWIAYIMDCIMVHSHCLYCGKWILVPGNGE